MKKKCYPKFHPQQKWSVIDKDELFVKVKRENTIMRIRRSVYERYWKEDK